MRSTKLLFDWENAAFVVTYAEKMAVAETSLVQKEPPNFNDHQPENHSKINRESLYDRYHRNFIGLYFDSHP